MQKLNIKPSHSTSKGPVTKLTTNHQTKKVQHSKQASLSNMSNYLTGSCKKSKPSRATTLITVENDYSAFKNNIKEKPVTIYKRKRSKNKNKE